MKFNEPLPDPPHKGHGWWALLITVFLLIMTFVCVADAEGWFRQ